jgi:hypothetical protein
MPRQSLPACGVLLACFALSACLVIPQPRDVIQLSRVDGQVTSGGQPLAGLPLTMNSLHNPAACDDPIARVVTGANGEFAFDEITARKTWRVVVLAPSSPTYSMTLCMQGGNGLTPIFAETIWATLPVTLSLHCDVDGAEGTNQACEVDDWTGYNFLSRSDEQRGEYREPAVPPTAVHRE